ncbi:hypothetical protein [Streptomyces mangrovi]|uniref:hypothetical protein n=1 Tax=Streptomyces mangrovi TaxID=1206892 RepID=UPI00399C5272
MADDENGTGRITRPTSDEVISALRSSGWLLEQDTALTLEKNGFYVTTNKAFPDPDDPSVSREIDVFGYRQLFRSDELSFSVGARVIVECKQSTMPYVVIGAPTDARETGDPRKEQVFRFPSVETGRVDLGDGRARLKTTPAREYLGLDKLPGNPWETDFIGNQLTRLERKKAWLADNRGIFTSLVYPLAKAVTYQRSQSNRSSYVMHRPGQDWATIDFYYPLIVTSAPLFFVDATAANIEAVEVPWVRVKREIKSAKVDGLFRIDVVTSESLARYLDKRVNDFCSAVTEVVESDPQRFVTHQDHDYRSRGA